MVKRIRIGWALLAMDIQVLNPTFAYLVVSSVVVVALALANGVARQRAATRFASVALHQQLFPSVSSARRLLSTCLITASIALLAIALMDIRWGKTTREVPQKGIEVMFALDVSRSMLAEDASPSRLQRAKQQINDMVDEMAGDRVGLIVFAGEAEQAVPLTSHYDDFKQILDTVGPHSVARGGSRLGEALQAAADGFIRKTNDHKTVVLFTDGEDQESQPVELARQLHADSGMRIFTVGLGDLEQGSRIPDSDSGQTQYVEHEGQQVWSKLNGEILRTIATETEGAYIPAGTKRVNMADVYHGYVANIQQTEFETAKINAYNPRFQWFAGAALLLMLWEVWNSTRSVTERRSGSSSAAAPEALPMNELIPTGGNQPADRSPVGIKVGAAAILLSLLLTLPSSSQTDSTVPSQINAANQLLRDQKISEAIDAFSRIDDAYGQHQDQLDYNLAVAHYRNGDFAAAQSLFAQAAQSLDTQIAANSRYNLGNCRYSQALQSTEQDQQSAIEALQAAISDYRSSLRLNRDNASARANIELASQLIRQLQKQQQDQSQQKQNQQSDSQDPTKQEQSADPQQQPDAQPSDSPDENQPEQESEESGQQSSQSGDEKSDPASDQDSQSSSSTSPSDATSDPEPQPTESEERVGDQSSPLATDGQHPSAEQNQQSPSQSDGESDPSDLTAMDENESDATPPPTGDLTATNEQETSAPNGESASQINLKETAGWMTREEALKMLQSVRDRDMLRRLRKQQRERSRRVPVERDW